MGRTAGAKGAFVAPQSREYAYRGITVGRLSPLKSSTPAEAWLDDLERLVGLEARGQVKAWVAGGLSEKRLRSAIRSSVDKRLVYERLKEADKGIHQQRIVVNEYANVPGIVNKPFVKNGLPELSIPASNFGVNDPALDLPGDNAATFTTEAKLTEIKPGEKLYRINNEPVKYPYAMTGGYWTRSLPIELHEVIGGTAVMPEWNSFQKVYEFTAPPYIDPVKQEPKFYVWEGPTAAQPVSILYEEKTDNGYCLPGGAMQIFVPQKLSRNPDFKNYIQDITSTHKSW